ncbi:MAG: hypothetical protein A3K19_24015 [Lentisphaerae bacterium RIFOXYB12_FULL_65_16]|nr:MAG: hypothetical protein A3K18_10270 [Lentisphaerae bacterium RIFOXYA12_64_32]OGV89583.1 MAG: hypothetical protein A3K19_24015 [Lentisphaerae bacterium RIFOXYB12_FULL_65_16]
MNSASSKKKAPSRDRELAATADLLESEEADRRRIRALLRLPMNQRTNFLRVKVGAGTAL